MKAIHLRTGYLKDPVGIDLAHPVLTWHADGGKKQTAYSVRFSVNGQPETETGKTESSSMRYVYPEPLCSRDRVEWSVVLWDENGTPGEVSEKAFFEAGLLDKRDWSALWIRGDYKASRKKRYPVDGFRKTFETKDVKKARLYISALGLYEARLNGQKVGSAVLAPGSTDPRVRVQVDAYDVTDLLSEGKNELTVLLADGWYRGSIGAKGSTCVFGTETKLIAQLEITNGKGERQMIGTDRTWAWSNDGALRFADLKDGETVDGRMSFTFGGHAVESAYDGLMTCSNNTRVVEIGESMPVSVRQTATGKTTLTYPHNAAGYLSFTVNAHDGDRIRIVLGELLDENGDVTLKNVQCVRKGKKTPLQEIVFICREGVNTYRSRFFYGGFRYATVETDAGVQPDYALFRQVSIGTELEETASFSCSNDLINTFCLNTVRSLRANSVDIPTDCPTRERMGWTGDSQVIFNTASTLFAYGAFARKHVRDNFDRQDKNGRLPQIAPYSAEDWFMDVMNGSVGWADAGVLIPYRMYLKYGDAGILKEHYDGMVRYAEFMIRRCGRPKGLYAVYAKPLRLSKENRKYGVNSGQSYGEWAEPADVKAFAWTDFAEPHPEESMAYTSYVLSLMADISELVGRPEDKARFLEYAEGVKRAYRELVTKPEHTLDTDRQAKLVRPLYMGLLTGEQTAYAKKRLIRALDAYGWRLGTGFLSTPFILDVLTDISPAYAYRLLENEEMPGWLYMAKHDTGTIWESWEGPNAQSGIASLNHYSKGAMVEWLFSGMLGIRVAGENRFLLKPVPGGHVTRAEGSYESIYGVIRSSWEKTDGKIRYRFEIPANTTAELILNGERRLLESGIHAFETEDGMENG
ncbi:MAG: family 78 glycoside hydrolase catalytic domain [Clostridia bacterium]|nr:family 78 glycoside hydrolase catalytic domain [Clostridia bacterium]